MPRAEATTEKARAVVLRTYSSAWSISSGGERLAQALETSTKNAPGRMVEIMWASPAALERLEMISRPSLCKKASQHDVGKLRQLSTLTLERSNPHQSARAR